MTKNDKSILADLICYHIVNPIKEYGVRQEDLAANALRLVQDLCKKEPGIAEEISFYACNGNDIAGFEFLDELNIKY